MKDFADFVDNIKNVALKTKNVMVSFDVKSMFTHVPVDYAVECCKTALDSDAVQWSLTSCAAALIFAYATHFSFNGSFYRQMFGTAMGASVSVACANLAMEALEESW